MIELQEELKNDHLDSLQLDVMNTTFFVAVSNSVISDWKNQLVIWLQYVENSLSRFNKNNELWNLNSAKLNESIEISPLLFDILQKAEAYRLKTEGRFSSLMLNQIEAHGYSQSFPFSSAPETSIPCPIRETKMKPFLFHEGFRITKQTNLKVDLGGIAKGYAVQAAANWLKKFSKSNFGIVDGGGDISVWSNGEKTWRIGVLNPFNEKNEIGSFSIQNGGIATSNIIYRSWYQGKAKKHHLLDGRTGMPVSNNVVQATVVMKHCLDAEIGAKICFMNDGLSIHSILSKLTPSFNYVIVNSDGKLEWG